MKKITTPIEGVVILEPVVFGDARGYFLESFRAEVFKSMGIPSNFVQDNESLSGKGVLRGLHFQRPPYAQGKLVRVVSGAVLDVAVDLRKNSATFGKHVAIELDETNKKMMWIPEGFAHGFVTLKDQTVFQYKCTRYYHPDAEDSIRWDDPELSIDWGVEDPVVSEKDQKAPRFNSFNSPF
jgi:dTDP-4-dehydrorhamnose 3,5-epimerase